MADWKEKGVVPDSDDEDFLDSQNTDGNAGTPPVQNFEFPPRNVLGDTPGVEPQDGDTLDGLPDARAHSPVDQGAQHDSPNLRLSEPPNDVLPPELASITEDISRSYVTLSSPLSSPPSSLSLSSEELEHGVQMGGHRDGIIQDFIAQEGHPDVFDNDPFDEFESMRRRSLRQRNPIQLHPYALEGEKYRRLFMASGMRPVRLAQESQQSSANQDNTDTEDTDFQVDADSQDLVPGAATLASSPILRRTAQTQESSSSRDRSRQSSPTYNADDEEFPDIDTLVEQRDKLAQSVGRTKGKSSTRSIDRPRVYSRKHRDHALQTEDTATQVKDIFDIPPSPPITSSQSPGFRVNREAASFLIPISSTTSRATSVDNISFGNSSIVNDNLTPITSAMKPSEEVETELEDPFDSDTSSLSSVTTPQPDETVQLQRIGKRIRGVLPASWLRLDQQTKPIKKTQASEKASRPKSPDAAVPRRGVAVPKSTTTPRSPKDLQHVTDIHFLSDDSEVEGGLENLYENDPVGLAETEDRHSQSDPGVAFEDDRIEDIFPSRKRRPYAPQDQKPRKVRKVATSLFRTGPDVPSIQPKITDHILRKSEPRTTIVKARRQKPSRTAAKTPSHRPRVKEPPKLSILDVIDREVDRASPLPDFIRVAARSARSRIGLGRHSPRRKYMRLASREDTDTIQAVLQSWKKGEIRQHPDVRSSRAPPRSKSSKELLSSSGKGRASRAKPRSTSAGTQLGAKRRFISTKSKQQSQIRWAANENDASPATTNTAEVSDGNVIASRKRDFAAFAETFPARPAQLETSETGSRGRNLSPVFQSTIKSMDSLYRKRHKGSAIKGDVQLARFLADDDMQQQEFQSMSRQKREPLPQASIRKSVTSRRKRSPNRLDVGAAKYRQPSDPLVLESLRQQILPVHYDQLDKLEGLGAFGTVYTISFDIFPLQEGIFFHESTFIGSGKLKKILEIAPESLFVPFRGHAVHLLGTKHLRWGPWNENVSTEIGGCFDWMTEQLGSLSEDLFQNNIDGVFDCLAFMIDYVQNHLSFLTPRDATACLLRFPEVSQVLFEFIASNADDLIARKDTVYRRVTELSVQTTVLLFLAFQISANEAVATETKNQMEISFLDASKLSIKMLLAGLDDIRTLYDDLQYLKVREAGIRPNRRTAEGFVIIMHILQVANVPRSSFWDLVNFHLIPQIKEERDARVLERTWYSMMSLLPLLSFDKSGVFSFGARSRISYENWQLPQKLCQRVFALYGSNERQSAGFNDYCRALFKRCNHLMQCWGWQHCGSTIGVLFDFFATHNLAHLRNEEVYNSPRFLSEAYPSPSLEIEPQDCTFHIFLKFLASAINRMRESAEGKGIRNLVTRVLPNHNRQYPRDKSIQRRDLASLRNHHDLLCTLYFAAPAESRPSLSLIRDLVSHDNSHKEASLINLEAWDNLAHFALSSGLTPSLYEPLASWQSEAFYQLTLQFVSAEGDVEAQLPHLPESDKSHPLSAIRKVVQNNKIAIMDILQKVVGDIRRLIAAAKTLPDLSLVFNDFEERGILKVSLQYFEPHDRATTGILIDVMKIILLFLKKRNRLIYGYDHASDELIAYQSDHLEPIRNNLSLLSDLTRKCMASSRGTFEIRLIEAVVETWAFVVKTFILTRLEAPYEFMYKDGKFCALDLDDQSFTARLYAPLFLGYLVRGRTRDEANHILVDRWNVVADFVCMLIRPRLYLRYIWFALFELSNAKLLEQITGEEIKALLMILPGRSLITPSNHFKDENNEAFLRRPKILADAFKVLHKMQKQKLLEKNYTWHFVNDVMNSMRHDMLDLEGMKDTDITDKVKKTHQNFIGEVALELKTYFPQLHDFASFFDMSCPTLLNPPVFVSYLRQYSVNLYNKNGSPQLLYYLLESFKNIVMHDVSSGMMRDQLVAAMVGDNIEDDLQLTKWILADLTPAFVIAAVQHSAGWFMAKSVIEADILKIVELAQNNHPFAAEATFTIMETLINALWEIKEWYDGDQVDKLKSSHIVLLDLILHFVTATFLKFEFPLFDAAGNERSNVLDQLQQLYFFAQGAMEYLRSPILALCGDSLRNVSPGAIMTELPSDIYSTKCKDPHKMDEMITATYEIQIFKEIEILIDPPILKDTARVYKHLTKKDLFDLFRTAGEFAHHPLPIDASDMKAIEDGRWPRVSYIFNGLKHVESLKPKDKEPRYWKEIVVNLMENWIFNEKTGIIILKESRNREIAGRLEVYSRRRRHFQHEPMDHLKGTLAEFLRSADAIQKLMAAPRQPKFGFDLKALEF